MKGTDWGRIGARVLSVVLVMKSLSLISSFVPNYLNYREQLKEFGGYPLTEIVLAGLLLVLAVLLWIFSDRFSPNKEDEPDEPKDVLTVATVFVAAIGAYFFFWQGNLALTEGLYKAWDQDAFKWEMKQPSFAFHIVTMAISVAIVLKSKALAAWMAR